MINVEGPVQVQYRITGHYDMPEKNVESAVKLQMQNK